MEEQILSPEERLAQLSDSLIASVINQDDVSTLNRGILFGQIPPRVFRDENYIIYKVLYDLKETGVVPDEEFLRLRLTLNEGIILNSSRYIDIDAFSELDESPAVAYVSAVLKKYGRLKLLPVLDTDEFKLVLEKYKTSYKSIELSTVYSEAKSILFDGVQRGKTTLQGYDDSTAMVKKGIADIDNIIDTTTGAGFVDASVVGLSDDSNTEPEKIGDFGSIKELNTHLGGIYTPYFYSILAPTKGGKSKFTTRMIHNIVVENGNNAVVWAHEGGYMAWLAQLRAVHYDWLYNHNETDISKYKRGVNQKVILEKTYPSENVRILEEASRVDLFSNESYGNIRCIDRPFKVETFIDEIETAVKLNGAKVVLIDYLQLIGTDSSHKSKPQVIGEAYQKLLAYAKKRNVAVISPAQFTQAFMNEMAKSKDGDSHEMRTAGGESSEIIRTPDINIGLYATKEDLQANTMRILSIPSRVVNVYPDFPIYCDLGVCKFHSLDID